MLSVAWAPDSKRISVASYVAPVWDVATGQVIHQLGKRSGIYDVAFSPDPNSGFLATATSSNTVQVWNALSGLLIVTLEGHTRHVRRVEFSADGRVLASSARDGSVMLWNCADWSEIALFSGEDTDHLLRPIVFHPSLPMVAMPGLGARVGSIEIYEYDLKKLVQQPARPSVNTQAQR